MEMYHPKLIRFHTGLKNGPKSSFDSIESVARIVLPFPVQTDIESRSNLAWKGNDTKMVYIDLKSTVKEYVVATDGRHLSTSYSIRL